MQDSTNGNGHTNGNGNGKTPPFVLAQPKTPEEIARDEIRRTMPRLRRECSRDARLRDCVGAKWLFGVLTDNSFLNDLGGDGWGRVYTSLKDLRRIYGHSVDALATWRDKLRSTGWIWFQDSWPKSCWGISSVCKQPELFSPHQDYVRVMAKGAPITDPLFTVGPPSDGKTADYGLNDSERLSDRQSTTVEPTAVEGQSDSQRLSHQQSLTVGVGGARLSDRQSTAATPTAVSGSVDSQTPVGPTAGSRRIGEVSLEGTSNPSNGGASIKRIATRAGGGGGVNARSRESEREFLGQCEQVLGVTEMRNNGGLWRTFFRTNKPKAWACLNETRSMHSEGRIKETPAKAMMDLWKKDRLKYDREAAR